MLSMDGCRSRQKRLLTAMEENRWDLFVTGNYRTAYYFTGSLGSSDHPVVFAIRPNGQSMLISSAKCSAAVDDLIPLESYSIHRAITRPVGDAADLLRRWGADSRSVSSVAIEAAATPSLIEHAIHSSSAVFHDASEVVLRLRKRKDPDEIEEIRGALQLCKSAYRAAKQAIAPGRTEIDVYNSMYAAVAQEAGTSVTFAGDFACGRRGIREGGPPTRRAILPGDLYILDIFPAPALYFGDTCRTFSVGPPTDVQSRAWEVVMQAIRLAEEMIRPGVPARDVYQAVKSFLDEQPITENSFWHHVGHGIGHHGHEAPRIIPGTVDIFEAGDVITIEPGVYTEAMQGGIRLEDNYVVREHGLENLFDFPMELI